MKELRPNAKRATYAITAIKVVLAINIIVLISWYLQYNLLQNIAQGQISIEKVESNNIRVEILDNIYSLSYIISIILFIMWFRRAYYNLHKKVTYLSWKEGWASGAWFVPILNLYRPYQIMIEMYEETQELLLQKDSNSNLKLSTLYVGLWWALWSICGIIGNIRHYIQMKTETIKEQTDITLLNIIYSIILISLAIITIKVIKDYSKAESFLLDIEEETINAN